MSEHQYSQTSTDGAISSQEYSTQSTHSQQSSLSSTQQTPPHEQPDQRRSRSPIRSSGGEMRRIHSEPPPESQRVIDYDNVRYRFVAGKRINSKMLHAIDEQQMYRYRVTHKNIAQYNCYIDTCKAKLYVDTVSGVCARKAKHTPHNHGPNDEIMSIQLVDSIKKRCRSATVAAKTGGAGNVRDIFHHTVRESVYFIFIQFFSGYFYFLF